MGDNPELIYIRTSRRGWVFMRVCGGDFRILRKSPPTRKIAKRLREPDVGARAIRTDQEAWALVLEHEQEIRKYARVLARKLRPATSSVVLDDACSEATMGAFRAAQLYDRSFNTRFMTVAKYWIRLHVQRHLLGRPNDDGKPSPSVIHIDETNEYDVLPPSIVDFDDIVFRGEARRLFRKALGRLPSIQRKVIRYRVQGKSFREIGESLGFSHEYARLVRNEAAVAIAAGIRRRLRADAAVVPLRVPDVTWAGHAAERLRRVHQGAVDGA